MSDQTSSSEQARLEAIAAVEAARQKAAAELAAAEAARQALAETVAKIPPR
ncbi:hypothetical protein GCM10010232_65890 [Streptomyces amakusaensis]|uniref:Uncharacterized protein n=1 Tax=Streptomyces amakusaensis TaxID=67271 RepID=A0ABW0AU83_9ACTN